MLILRKQKSINEAKQVGNLYHICRVGAALYNLKYNKIVPGRNANIVNGRETISFTRDKNFIVNTMQGSDVLFQFVLDGDLLSEHIKIQPYADHQHGDDYVGKNSEQEEVILGKLKDLKKYLKGINVFIVTKDYEEIIHSDLRFYYPLYQALVAVKKTNVPVQIKTLKNANTASDSNRDNTTIPKDLDSLIKLMQRVMDYDSATMHEVVVSLSKRFFSDAEILQEEGNKISILYSYDEFPKIRDVQDEVFSLVDTIREQMESEYLLVLEDKLKGKASKRHDENKLNSLLNNKTYLLSELEIQPVFDWIYSSSPYVKIQVQTSNESMKNFYVYFL